MGNRTFGSVLLVSSLLITSAFWPASVFGQTCVPNNPPLIAAEGGVSWSEAAKILKEDGQALLLGSQGKSMGDSEHESPAGGWVLLDFGCFSDVAGADLEIYELGNTEGGEIYVGGDEVSVKLSPRADGFPGGSGWQYVKAAVPPHYALDCDGNETLPEADKDCQTGDSWLPIDIGKNDGASYRYVYLWSDGSAKGDAPFGGSSDFDVIRILAPISDLDLFATIDGEEKQFVDFVPVGTDVTFSVNVSDDLKQLSATYDCGPELALSSAGTLDLDSGTQTFECAYPNEGIFTASVKVGEMSDIVKVYVGKPAPAVVSTNSTNGDNQFGLRMFLWGVVLCLLGYGIVAMLRPNLKK